MSKEKTKAELIKDYEGRIAQLTTANKSLDKQLDMERNRHEDQMHAMRTTLSRASTERNQQVSDNEGLVRIIKAKQQEIDELRKDTIALEQQTKFGVEKTIEMVKDRDRQIYELRSKLSNSYGELDTLRTVVKNAGITEVEAFHDQRGELVAVAFIPGDQCFNEDPREDFFEWKRRRTVRGWELIAVCDACGLC